MQFWCIVWIIGWQFLLLIDSKMATDRDDSLQSISVKLNGKNFSYWSTVMKNFLKGKKLWGYVSGTVVQPTSTVNNYVTELDVWESNDAKILTWIHNSVEHSIGTQLVKYETAKEVWDHLQKLFTKSNFAKRYQLENDIRTLQQKNMSILEFYNAMTSIWDELALTESTGLKECKDYITYREEQRLVQFLMALRSDFEGLRGSILHRTPLPSVDSVVSELVAEETRLKSLAGEIFLPSSSTSVLAVPSQLPMQNQNKSYMRVASDECSFCKQKGHWKFQCSKLLKKQQSSQSQQQSQQRFYRPNANTVAIVPPPDSSVLGAPPISGPLLTDLAEQFQKFLATQPHAMSANLSSQSPSGISSSWIFDSGASKHMSPHITSFDSLCPSNSSLSVMTANGTPLPLAGVGSVNTHNLSLSDVYCVPALTLNLISVGQLCDSGYLVQFSSTACCVQDPRSQKLIGIGRRQGGLYVLDNLRPPHVAASGVDLSSFSLNSSSSSFYLWHSRLGHVSASRLKFLASKGHLGDLSTHDISDCSGCKLAKFSALPFARSVSCSVAPFDLVHSDVWGPAPIATKGGSRYYVSFIDDYSRYCWVYLMKHRSDFLPIYRSFKALVKTQHSSVIKCFRCDLGGEYTSTDFSTLLASDGTIHQTSCTDTPQQNGVAERKYRHIVETARSLLLSAKVPSEFWGEAVLTAVSLINKIPSSHTLGLSPFETLFGHPPNYSLLKVFGCTCFVLRPKVERSKLTSRSALCVFLGYGEGQKGYRCFDPIHKKLYVSRHVVFLEHIPFFSISDNTHDVAKSDLICIDPFSDDFDSPLSHTPCTVGPSCTSGTHTPAQVIPTPSMASQAPSEIVDLAPAPPAPPLPPPPRYPQRLRKSTQLPDFAYSCYSDSFRCFLTSIHQLYEPSSYKEAILDPLWQQAMTDELSALHKTDTWDLVLLPPGKHAIGSRWVYKIKTKSDGSIERYKARLVAKGFSQQYGLDYEETFAPVAKMTTVRTLIAVASIHQWSLSQLDVKNAFLNGNLQEDVYMVPPPGVSHDPGYVCKLKKALYGLKQAPRAWFERFSTVVASLGFTPSHHDSALFFRCTSAGRILLLLYVDDMIITGDDGDGIIALKCKLACCFEMKDLGYLSYFLGIEVASSPRGYLLS